MKAETHTPKATNQSSAGDRLETRHLSRFARGMDTDRQDISQGLLSTPPLNYTKLRPLCLMALCSVVCFGVVIGGGVNMMIVLMRG